MSVIFKDIVVGVNSSKLSLLTTEKGIRFMVAPESHIAFPNSYSPIVHGIVKLPGYCIFYGMFF